MTAPQQLSPNATAGTLTIELLDLWQAGSGRGAGQHIDSVPVLDSADLPYLPGRTVKGLLRDAVRHLETIGALKELDARIRADALVNVSSITNWLFGTRHESEEAAFETGPGSRFNTVAGKIWVSDARLSQSLQQAIEKQQGIRSALFHDVYSTAIDSDTGQATDQSLRSIRVAVPMTLSAPIEVGHIHALDIIEAALPLIDAVGSQRTRGLGRCVWTLKRETAR